MSDDYNKGCGGSLPLEKAPEGGDGTGAPDVVYAIEAESDGQLMVGFSTWSLELADWDMLVYVLTSCDEGTCPAYWDVSEPGMSKVLDPVPVTAGSTTYLVVDGVNPGSAGQYNLNISLSPP